MPVIGFLHSSSPESTVSRIAAFRKGLAETGYVEGQNVAIEFRWGQWNSARPPGGGEKPRSPRAITASRPPYRSSCSACRFFARIHIFWREQGPQLPLAFTNHSRVTGICRKVRCFIRICLEIEELWWILHVMDVFECAVTDCKSARGGTHPMILA